MASTTTIMTVPNMLESLPEAVQEQVGIVLGVFSWGDRPDAEQAV